MEITFLPTSTPKIHLHVEQLLQNTYWTLAEDLRLPKSINSPCTWVGQKKKEKTETKEYGWDLHLWEGAVKEEKFPHARKPLPGRDGEWVGKKFQSHGGERSNRGAEGKAERCPHRGSVPTSTHQPERLVCSPAGAGWGWELRLRLWRSDPRERTGVGCMSTDWRGLVCHS